MNLIDKILLEAQDTAHSLERMLGRFLDNSSLVVGYELRDSIGEYVKVGTYEFSEANKETLLRNVKIIQDFKFPIKKSYGVKVIDIMIDKNKVNYFTDSLKKESKGETLVIVHSESNSNGNVIYAIIRENKVITIYYGKNYVVQDATKMNVDHIIKCDTILSGKVR